MYGDGMAAILKSTTKGFWGITVSISQSCASIWLGIPEQPVNADFKLQTYQVITPFHLSCESPSYFDRRTLFKWRIGDRIASVSAKFAAPADISRSIFTDKKKSNHRKSKFRENLATPDGNTSQTDDSGIVTSPPTSPTGIKTIEVAADTENVESLMHKTVEPPEIQTDQSQSVQHTNHYETIHPSQSQPEQSHAPTSTSPAPNSLKREPNRSSNTLIVRRCSDSVVKLRYSSLPNRRPRHQEPPIREQHEDQQSTSNTSYYEVTINDGDITNNITKHKHSKLRDSKQSERVSKTNRDVRTSSEDATKVDDDVTNPGGKTGIKNMISKYETLSKINEGKKRESMAESIARYNEWNTLERNGGVDKRLPPPPWFLTAIVHFRPQPTNVITLRLEDVTK